MGLGVQFILIAGLFVAASNYCMRKSIDVGGTTKAFLMIQLFIVFLVAILLNPVRTGHYGWSTSMATFGFFGGLLLAVMMAALGRALECGPAGLTFAVLNSSTVMPILVMVAIFGGAYGFHYTLFNALGSVFVVGGMFWAGWQVVRMQHQSRWAVLALTAFCCHVAFLVFMQWRALMMHFPKDGGLYLSFEPIAVRTQWFMPMIFLAAFLVQAGIFLASEKRVPNIKESIWSILGGITNGVGTFFLINATEVATSYEHAMLFPLFSVSIILLSNGWGQLVYKEKVNWWANGLCVLGILIGTLDWKVLT
jgi:hypothetical protein